MNVHVFKYSASVETYVAVGRRELQKTSRDKNAAFTRTATGLRIAVTTLMTTLCQSARARIMREIHRTLRCIHLVVITLPSGF